MSSTKASGLDGFTAVFFKAIWSFLSQGIWELVEESRKLFQVWSHLNTTFLALIPKSQEATKPGDFCPISLYNVICKILSTIMVRRLKPLLHRIISHEHSGFVARQILDGIISAHETIHSIKSHKLRGILLKLDLLKAYDRLSQEYLLEVVRAFGFSLDQIQWVKSMISTSFFSILGNGMPSGTFWSSRGIRQVDPLSPFLFTIIVEGFGHLHKAAKKSHQISWLHLSGSNIDMTHQQFMDDNLLFGVATLRESSHLNNILEFFQEASGMILNKLKSDIFFFNTPAPCKHDQPEPWASTLALSPLNIWSFLSCSTPYSSPPGRTSM